MPQNLSVYLDDKETQEFVVNVSKSESKPARDYEVGTLTSNPEKVRITGPKSLMGKIDRVSAAINVTGRSEDFSQDKILTIYDRNQDPLTDAEMNSLRIENNGKVTVSAKLWKVRKDVKLTAAYMGEPADGYQVGTVNTLPDTISVAGSQEALDTLAQNNNVIEIPGEEVDISGKSRDAEIKVSLIDVLPAGLKLVSDSSEDVWVTVNILPFGSEAFDFLTKEIEVKNKPKDLQIAFETAQIEIRIKSEGDNLDKLNVEKDVKVSIDLKGKEEGSYEVPVDIKLPEGYELVDDVVTEVVISAGTVVEEEE